MAQAKAKTSYWFLWWIVDDAKLAKEIARYGERNPFKTARGVSALCLLLSVVITIVVVALKVFPANALIDAGISLFLALFCYLGHRWALLSAMAWWTLEKGVSIVESLTGSNGGFIFTNLIWWAAYMGAFWLAFRVEQERRRPKVLVADVFE